MDGPSQKKSERVDRFLLMEGMLIIGVVVWRKILTTGIKRQCKEFAITGSKSGHWGNQTI
ncbi:hypothetical protein BDR03DRAFT_967429 [Suillus americanus]|nr:hypothetical protein BDR03DRAFT_967429 [Suillus americanus]